MYSDVCEVQGEGNVKLLLEEYDLRCEMDSAGTGEIRFCGDSNTHIRCSFMIKQLKLNVKNFNNTINIYQSDKCANECPEFDTKH